MRNDFLDAASHELKTPLTSLSLQLQLISKMAETPEPTGASPEKLRFLAADAHRQLSRMTHLIDRWLDVSGIRAGKLELKEEEFDLAEGVRREVQDFQRTPGLERLEITVNAPQPIPGRWDRERILEVLRTLLANAVQYGLKRPIEVSVWADRARARISVRDQGIGITDEQKKRIFEEFERGVDGDHFNGLGLGLYVAKQIALAHKGSLEVESKPGEGAVFTLKLPLSPPKSETADQARSDTATVCA